MTGGPSHILALNSAPLTRKYPRKSRPGFICSYAFKTHQRQSNSVISLSSQLHICISETGTGTGTSYCFPHQTNTIFAPWDFRNSGDCMPSSLINARLTYIRCVYVIVCKLFRKTLDFSTGKIHIFIYGKTFFEMYLIKGLIFYTVSMHRMSMSLLVIFKLSALAAEIYL